MRILWWRRNGRRREHEEHRRALLDAQRKTADLTRRADRLKRDKSWAADVRRAWGGR